MYAAFLLDRIKFVAGQKPFFNTKSWEVTKCTTIPYGCDVPWVSLVLCQDPSLFSEEPQALSTQFAGSSLLLLAVSPSLPNLPSPPQRNVVLEHCLTWLTSSLSSCFPIIPGSLPAILYIPWCVYPSSHFLVCFITLQLIWFLAY